MNIILILYEYYILYINDILFYFKLIIYSYVNITLHNAQTNITNILTKSN